MSIQQEITNWDGKSVDDLQAVFDCYSQDAGFGAELVQLLKESSLQLGASWLLKRFLETGHKLSTGDLKLVYNSLSDLEEWGAELHLLQCLPYLKIGKSQVKKLESFLRGCVASQNKFVRAWAYNGFYELALQHPRFKAEVDLMLEQALEDEAASVKARIRNIRKVF